MASKTNNDAPAYSPAEIARIVTLQAELYRLAGNPALADQFEAARLELEQLGAL